MYICTRDKCVFSAYPFQACLCAGGGLGLFSVSVCLYLFIISVYIVSRDVLHFARDFYFIRAKVCLCFDCLSVWLSVGASVGRSVGLCMHNGFMFSLLSINVSTKSFYGCA